MNWVFAAIKKYTVFQGRARRSEFWFFFLFVMVGVFVLAIIDNLIGIASQSTGIGLFSVLFLLSMLLPSIAAQIRRLHDTGRSGWWSLVNVIPYVGSIILLVLLALPGEEGANKWGENPKMDTR
jgi:uncharacterized membrane protein YhaH (DUF805 family)